MVKTLSEYKILSLLFNEKDTNNDFNKLFSDNESDNEELSENNDNISDNDSNTDSVPLSQLIKRRKVLTNKKIINYLDVT